MQFRDCCGVSGRVSGVKEQPHGTAVPAGRKTGLLGQWEALCALRGTADPKGASWILCAVGWPR